MFFFVENCFQINVVITYIKYLFVLYNVMLYMNYTIVFLLNFKINSHVENY